MKTILIILIGLCSLMILYKAGKKTISVSGIFVFMWTFCASLNSLGLYGLRPISWNVTFLVCISILIFTVAGLIKMPRIVGTFSIRFPSIHLRLKQKESGLKERALCTTGLLAVNMLVYIIAIPQLRLSLHILMTKGIYFVRNYAFSSMEGRSTATLLFYQLFVYPLFMTTILLTCIDIGNKRAHKSSIIISIVNVLLYTVMFAGRYMLLEFMLYFIFAVYNTSSAYNLFDFIKKRKKACVAIACIGMVIVMVTSLRQSDNLWKSTYIYFCGSFSYLDYLVEHNIGTDLYLCGSVQMGLLYNFVALGLAVLGFNTTGSSQIVTTLTASMVPIGGGVVYNALGTALHDFMADYGLWGSLFGMAVFAIACNMVEAQANYKKTPFCKALYYYILFVVFNSVLGYAFRSPSSLIFIFMLWVFTHNRHF